ncbi:hypothetical protein ACEWY4_011233 [Coilia grayii]|uniref:G-protein coupled receptors family 1 profile domain-containing protein n=1 Tax=Coilia grayii TaxID=363190 RepID=A0ABD1K466_9TELE
MQDNISHVLGFTNTSIRINYVHLVLTVTSSALLFFTLFIGIAANLFVAWAVRNQKSLQTSNNALLVNLAVIDFLRCVIDCPFILEIFLNRDRIDRIGLPLCDAQFFSFSVTCCVQLLTLASISAERYQAIAHPFKTTERRKRVMIWIPLTWTVAISVSVICLLFAKDSPVYARCKGLDIKELPTYGTFGMYVLVPLWAACLAVITGFYTRIFVLVKTHNRKIFDKGTVLTLANSKAKTKKESTTIKEIITIVPEVTVKTAVLPRAQEERAPGDNTQVCGNNAVSEPLNAGDQELTVDRQRTDTSRVVSENINSEQPPQASAVVVIDLETREEGSALQPPPLMTESESATLKPVVEILPDNKPTVTNPAEPENQDDVAGAVCMMPSRPNPDRAKKNKEGKLAKRSGYIILTFLILWTPFILTVLANYFIRRSNNTSMEIALELEILTISFVCMTSVTNPITYAAVNPQFRTEFYSLRSKFKSICMTK